MIDRRRVKHELAALADCFEEVRFDLDEGWVELEPVLLPDGWNRETTTVRIEFSEYYPSGQPKLYVPDGLRFNSKRPTRMLRPKKDRWARYLVGFYGPDQPFGIGPDPTQWDPDRHTTLSMIRRFGQTLPNPNDADPTAQHKST